MEKKRAFRFEVKKSDLKEDGSFVGLASTYGNVDSYDDVVDPGAFTKTLKERGPEVPILWSHDPKQPIGIGQIEDSENGLIVKAQLDLDTQAGKDAYSRIKKGIVKGLSIGFETVKKSEKDGIRHLTEIKLFEVSLCVFPANVKAQLTNVKVHEQKDDFLTELDEAQTWAFRYMAISALNESLCETLQDEDLSPEDKTSASSTSIMQFHDTYLEMLPKIQAVMDDRNGGMYYYSKNPKETKVGRKLSATNRKKVESALAALQALLAEAADTSTSGDGAATTEASKAKSNVIEPEQFHSLMSSYTKSLTGDLKTCLS